MKRWCGLLLPIVWLMSLPVFGQGIRFSHDGGFYADTFCLSIEASPAPDFEGCTIHYTLNGAAPTECDPAYTAPIPLSAECLPHSEGFKIQTVPDGRWYAPDEVERCIVVRAAAFDADGERRTPVETQTYLIESLLGRRIGLPVVSLCLDSSSLFDYDTGIFAMGYYHNPTQPYNTGNYFQKGRDWERAAAFAYYDTDGSATAQDCGLRMHGNSQRVLAQKGLSLHARRDYGNRFFRHRFFPDLRQESFRRLVLRPWKTSWSAAGIEDWLCQQLAAQMQCDALATRPVVLFLNGEYWGIYFLEEKGDEHYVEEHYGIDDESVDLLTYWGDEVEHGTAARWNRFYDWLQQADLNNDEDMRRLGEQVDIDALTDYMLLQVLVLNDDWPVNNVRFWGAEGERWHWIFFDGDGALASFPDNAVILDNMTYRNAKPTTHSTPRATLLFRRLLENKDFLRRSMERMADLTAGPFAYEQTAPLLQSIVAQVEDEVPHQIARFGTPTSMVRWRMAVELIDDFLRTEPEATMHEYAQYFGLTMPGTGLPVTVEEGRLLIGQPASANLEYRIYDINGRLAGQLTVPEGASSAALPALPHGRYMIQPVAGGAATRWIIM